MKNTISFLALMLATFLLFATSCKEDFDPKSGIIINENDVSDGELISHDAGFWGDNIKKKDYDINNDGTNDIRIFHSFSAPAPWTFYRSLRIEPLTSNTSLVSGSDTLLVITEPGIHPDSTYGLVRYYLHPGDTSYSDSASVKEVVNRAPFAFNAGDELTSSMTFVGDNLPFMNYSCCKLNYGSVELFENLSYKPWDNVMDKYVGLKYTNGQEVYLGWLKVSVKSDHSVKLSKSYFTRVE